MDHNKNNLNIKFVILFNFCKKKLVITMSLSKIKLPKPSLSSVKKPKISKKFLFNLGVISFAGISGYSAYMLVVYLASIIIPIAGGGLGLLAAKKVLGGMRK